MVFYGEDLLNWPIQEHELDSNGAWLIGADLHHDPRWSNTEVQPPVGVHHIFDMGLEIQLQVDSLQKKYPKPKKNPGIFGSLPTFDEMRGYIIKSWSTDL